jgi:hypothetical protein
MGGGEGRREGTEVERLSAGPAGFGPGAPSVGEGGCRSESNGGTTSPKSGVDVLLGGNAVGSKISTSSSTSTCKLPTGLTDLTGGGGEAGSTIGGIGGVIGFCGEGGGCSSCFVLSFSIYFFVVVTPFLVVATYLSEGDRLFGAPWGSRQLSSFLMLAVAVPPAKRVKARGIVLVKEKKG